MVELEDVASPEHEVWLSRHSVASLCVCSVQRAKRRGSEEAVHSAGHTAAEPSVKEYKTAFPSTCHLRTVWSYKYEHRSSVNITPFFLFVIQTQTVHCQDHRRAAL